MDPLLLSTIVSLLAAAGLAVITWQMRRQQHERSAARVAALAASVDDADEFRSASTIPVAVSSMFETAPGRAVQSRPIIKVAVGLVMAILLIVITAMGGGGGRDNSRATQTTAAAAAPLELVSMRHTRDGGGLKVAGLVRNPRTGAPASRLTAVVFAFDRNGSFLASGRAPLDFMTLEPGDESSFVVNVADAANAARYRVSFRTDEGIIRHVDRRESGTYAAAK